jgi:hypothetical protein
VSVTPPGVVVPISNGSDTVTVPTRSVVTCAEPRSV